MDYRAAESKMLCMIAEAALAHLARPIISEACGGIVLVGHFQLTDLFYGLVKMCIDSVHETPAKGIVIKLKPAYVSQTVHFDRQKTPIGGSNIQGYTP
jgi:hypothetical protein